MTEQFCNDSFFIKTNICFYKEKRKAEASRVIDLAAVRIAANVLSSRQSGCIGLLERRGVADAALLVRYEGR